MSSFWSSCRTESGQPPSTFSHSFHGFRRLLTSPYLGLTFISQHSSSTPYSPSDIFLGMSTDWQLNPGPRTSWLTTYFSSSSHGRCWRKAWKWLWCIIQRELLLAISFANSLPHSNWNLNKEQKESYPTQVIWPRVTAAELEITGY